MSDTQKKTQTKLRIWNDPAFLAHNPGGPGNPETSWRAEAVLRALETLKSNPSIRHINACPVATPGQLSLGHDDAYVKKILALEGVAGTQLDDETILGTESSEAAQRAVGGTIIAADTVIDGEAETAFVFTRPPGHHATREGGMGYCIFNNIAIAAKSLAINGYKVLIIDIDAHHGNGTEDIVRGNDNILFCSIHQQNLFPTNSGNESSGNILNLPIPMGSDGELFTLVLESALETRLHTFHPNIILVSCGFDALDTDPLSNLRLLPQDYTAITRFIKKLARHYCSGKIVFALEGGYDTDRLPECIISVCEELAK